jgi:hypothetical protein
MDWISNGIFAMVFSFYSIEKQPAGVVPPASFPMGHQVLKGLFHQKRGTRTDGYEKKACKTFILHAFRLF